MMFEKVNQVVDEIIRNNLNNDMTERQIADLIDGSGPFAYTMTSACPTSFLICC